MASDPGSLLGEEVTSLTVTSGCGLTSSSALGNPITIALRDRQCLNSAQMTIPLRNDEDHVCSKSAKPPRARRPLAIGTHPHS
jgi:hypothetical protein